MIIRNISEVEDVDWGNGISRRFLTAKDGLGYTLTDTIVNAGTRSPLEYKNHLEACYCIAGSGSVIDADGNEYPLVRLICVFSPALVGNERHDFSLEFSNY
jgi:L-ectoine synthase